MREAVIVSTARTPIGKAYRGAFNDTQAQTLGGHAIANALKRASVDPGEVDDVVMGAAMQQGSQGGNVARQALLRAGLPTSVAGMSVDRQCASGLMAIATAAKEIIDDGMSVTIGGGLESISLVQNDKMNRYRAQDPWLVEHRDDVYMTMIETAETVAERYQVTRQRQDEYALQSQQRTAAAQAAGRFDVEIAGAHVVVIGRGVTVGRPLGLLLTRRSENATVTLCHTGTRNLPELARQADVIVAAVGVPHMVTPDMVKPGAAVVDVGVSRDSDGKLVGDVHPGVWDVAGHVSPNPGGVGPLTRAFLLTNVVELDEAKLA